MLKHVQSILHPQNSSQQS